MAGELATAGGVHEASPLAATAGEATYALEQVIITGDLAKLTPEDRLRYYGALCQACGLNPLARPFEYLSLKGKLVLYATKGCGDQLRNTRGISTRITDSRVVEGVYVVTAVAFDPKGREEHSTGAVAIDGLKGEDRANAMMKAETKAKRRATLSFTGLGLLDDSEVDTVRGAERVATESPARQPPRQQTALPASPPASPAPPTSSTAQQAANYKSAVAGLTACDDADAVDACWANITATPGDFTASQLKSLAVVKDRRRAEVAKPAAAAAGRNGAATDADRVRRLAADLRDLLGEDAEHELALLGVATPQQIAGLAPDAARAVRESLEALKRTVETDQVAAVS